MLGNKNCVKIHYFSYSYNNYSYFSKKNNEINIEIKIRTAYFYEENR